MVETIKETFYEKNIAKDVKEPFSLALKLKEEMGSFGKVEEKENKIFTTEEGSVLVLKFDAIKSIDNVTEVIFSFNIEADIKRINITIIGFVLSTFDEKDKTFSDFYKLELYPEILEDAKKIIEKTAQKIENIIENWK